jgi:alpha-beta hydrolase superfamily lysophospholipase
VAAINGWKGQAPKPASSAPVPSPSAAAVESRSLADRYDDLGKRIDALALTSPELLPRAQRYQKLAREAATALRDVAEAVENGEAARARQRRVKFDDLSRNEAPLVAEINGICR